MKFPINEIKKNLYRYVKFVFGGGISLVLNLLITYLLTELLYLWHMLSFGIALGLETIFLFVYHSKVTFKTNGKFKIFAIVILFISGLNWILVYLLTEKFGLQYLIAIILVAGVVSILNYIINRNLVFKEKSS